MINNALANITSTCLNIPLLYSLSDNSLPMDLFNQQLPCRQSCQPNGRKQRRQGDGNNLLVLVLVLVLVLMHTQTQTLTLMLTLMPALMTVTHPLRATNPVRFGLEPANRSHTLCHVD
ncbi:hypothetical protein [Serratia sp. AKBS12]|uniref:hypothetical protein n=1 Tax=Serratia sp. AKBS12 TaxID=2974597 RepID=UPI0021653180|nr:hypothetical protein [Serratia sp. AKBS12]MCS3409458.1 hypothetical protein [Serratia sp. AKBS12]